MTLWFGKSPALDEQIRSKFGGLVELAAKGDLDSWTVDPHECLALVILLDQFPRNIFRYATGTLFGIINLITDQVPYIFGTWLW